MAFWGKAVIISAVKISGKMQACTVFVLLSSTVGVFAINGGNASGNPYSSIINRNMFDLHAPEPVAPPVSNAPPSNIKLTGITTIMGSRRAFLMVTEPGQPEKSCILSEQQRDGGVEVLAINEKEGSVKVDNGGTIVTLTFDKDGNKLPSMPAPMKIAAVPPVPAPAPAPAAQASQYAAEDARTPEVHVQEVMIEVNRQRYIDAGDPRAKLLPPTSLSKLQEEN